MRKKEQGLLHQWRRRIQVVSSDLPTNSWWWVLGTCISFGHFGHNVCFCNILSYFLILSWYQASPLVCSPTLFLSLNFLGIFFHAICPSVCHLLSLLVIAFYFPSANAQSYYSTPHLRQSQGSICRCEHSGTFIVQLFLYLEVDLFKVSWCRICF